LGFAHFGGVLREHDLGAQSFLAVHRLSSLFRLSLHTARTHFGRCNQGEKAMNYGEDISYWYFRLNGFFLVQNFVLHGDDAGIGQCQIDLMDVRPRFVNEAIGGLAVDWDPELFNFLGSIIGETHAVICQVKTGRAEDIEDDALFRPETLEGLINRFGLIEPRRSRQVAERLVDEALVRVGRTTLSKILVSKEKREYPSYLSLWLDDLEEFVEARARKYAPEKYRDRMLFPWGLFQFAVNRANRPPQRANRQPPRA
jgi:hypothetical protein